VVFQWLKRVDVAGETGRLNSTITFRHDGHVYALLVSRDVGRTSVTTSRRRDGAAGSAATYVSRLTVSRVTLRDAGLYVCVVTGKYGVRSQRAVALNVRGQRHSSLNS